MNKLFEGVRGFTRRDYEKHRSIYDELKERQAPHTLFVTCSDSRIVPSLITQSMPGELFIIRNVANIVPPVQMAEHFTENLSAVEYAVQALDVKQVVICGHSNCGGCRALFAEPDEIDALPYTRRWLQHAHVGDRAFPARCFQADRCLRFHL